MPIEELVVERLARAIHARYLTRWQYGGRATKAQTTSPAGVPWHLLGADIRDANRDQARDIMVKLASIGCSIAAASAPDPSADPPTAERREPAETEPAKTEPAERGEPAETEQATAEFAFTDAELDRLARHEHERWSRQRMSTGWSYGPARDDAAKQHPSLVPWRELCESERDKDRDAVRDIPAVLATAGLRVVRD